ncbi:uncharacterized protein LOC131242770 [Magnolia sinica]|uniref:uncharacterized protein LOC131242770 n=1 Tax=Magnolia sinica TaxID=86752 RepID=UPI00265AF4E2|nr:uncharacterized protein LOC131242770 [Magnolia sinica]
MNSENPPRVRPSKPPKRLLFDRRYGWVFDEWKEPSEEALSGGRGMFCILPLAKALVKIATQSVNFAVVSVDQFLRRPKQFSPQALKVALNDQFQKFMCSIKRTNLNLLTPKGNSSILSEGSIQHVHLKNNGSENG